MRTGTPSRSRGWRRGCGRGRRRRRGGRPGHGPPADPLDAAPAVSARLRRPSCQAGRGVDTLHAQAPSRPRGEHGRPGPQPAQHPQVHRPAGRRARRRASAPRRHGRAVRRQPAAVAVRRGARPRDADGDHRVAPVRQDAAVGAGRHRRLRRPGERQVAVLWEQDCSAGTENVLIEAEALGLGAVWLGVHPLRGARRGAARAARHPRVAWCRSPSSPSASRRSARSRPTATTRRACTPSAGEGAVPTAPRLRSPASRSCRAGTSATRPVTRRAPPSGLAPARQAPPHGSSTSA